MASIRFTSISRNALGSHWEGEDPMLRNEENKCYCMDDQGFYNYCHQTYFCALACLQEQDT